MWDPVLVCWSSHGVKGVHSVHEGRKSESRPKHVNWIKLHNSFPRRLVTWSAGWFKLWQAEEVWSGLVDPKIASCQIFCGGLVPAIALQCFCFRFQNVFSMDLETPLKLFNFKVWQTKWNGAVRFWCSGVITRREVQLVELRHKGIVRSW